MEGDKIIPPQVYDQVVLQGKERGDSDALVSEELVRNGILQVVGIESRFLEELRKVEVGLHRGELEVLALAKDKKGKAVLDESMAREVGKIFGIEVHGSLYLIFLMIKKGVLERKEAKDKVNVMIKNEFRLGHEGYLKFLELLETI